MGNKHYLVTGGTGFIGAALVRALVQAGHRVRVLDNNSRGALRRLGDALSSVEMVEADIRDPEAVARACAGVDAVAHLAYVNGTRFFYEKPGLVLDVAVRGMLNVLDGCTAHQVPELILASSSEVYQTPPLIPTPEDVPLIVPDVHNPRYSYGGGKLISELLALHYAALEKVMIFRPHNVYGPDMGTEHVIPEFALRLKALDAATPAGAPVPFPIQGSGQETRAFIYIDDFTAGLMRILDAGETRTIYHIGTQEEVTIAHIAREVAACFGRQLDLQPGPSPAGGTARRCPDTSRLCALGFQPQISLSEGIQRTTQWYAENA